MSKTNETTNARPDWIELAEAKMHLENLVRQNEAIADNSRDCMIERQNELARYIEKDRWGENANAEEIERTGRMMAEYKQDIDRHKLLAAAYRAAAEIIDAVSGAYFYAAQDGWYDTHLAKFETAEKRDAFLEENADTEWRAATSKDMDRIFWAGVTPTSGAPEF